MGLETVEIVLWAEEEFGIEIPQAEASALLTIGEFVAYLRARTLARHGATAPAPTTIFDKLALLLEHRYRVPRDWIQPEASFHQDLGLG